MAPAAQGASPPVDGGDEPVKLGEVFPSVGVVAWSSLFGFGYWADGVPALWKCSVVTPHRGALK